VGDSPGGHGLGEHGGRYGNVAAALVAAGIDVHAYDHRALAARPAAAYVERWSIFDDLQECLSARRAAWRTCR
jgi:alpha-beta hydrolase superfamily lysophospholipase